MKIAASQPTFLSYPGYYGMIDLVDKFIIMDNIQFDARSWQQRNYILFNKNQLFLTIPVQKKNKMSQKISEVKIDVNKDYINKHLKTIEAAYKKKPFFNDYFEKISNIYTHNSKKLFDLNLEFIIFFSKILKIQNKIELLSNLDLEKFRKDELIYEICKKTKCKEYISSIGSKTYLEKNYELKKNINIKYFKYIDENNKFSKSHLSILDLIFNHGPESLKIIRSKMKLI
jgi:hypothetical protein